MIRSTSIILFFLSHTYLQNTPRHVIFHVVGFFLARYNTSRLIISRGKQQVIVKCTFIDRQMSVKLDGQKVPNNTFSLLIELSHWL
jgi:hypothetical protein